MHQGFKRLSPEELNESAFRLIGKDWMLVAAGDSEHYNMMTASWGGFGILWNKPVVTVFIRPHRYTYEFVEKNDYFSISFFTESFRKTLNLLGSQSGRDINKMAIEGLNAVFTENNTVYFDQAKLVLECKKLYMDDIKPGNFLDKGIVDLYPKKDYHRLYIGEVVNILKSV
jgi:flavin reductase (DIM6/NTAB) family NADH-FMN oxidoreductase RutF